MEIFLGGESIERNEGFSLARFDQRFNIFKGLTCCGSFEYGSRKNLGVPQSLIPHITMKRCYSNPQNMGFKNFGRQVSEDNIWPN